MYLKQTLSYLLLCSFISLFVLLPNSSKAQTVNPENFDYVYQDHIATVRFHLGGIVLSSPIVELNSPARLELRFDDLDGDDRDYVYTIRHCNADWTFSDLNDLEYLEGFNGERMTDYQYSFQTLTSFTHYRLSLPNDDIRWTKSGNYLLQVFEDNDEKTPVLCRRFMVVSPRFRVIPENTRPAKVSKYRTHHEIDFIVSHKGINVQNPQMEVKVAILQNGRWDNAITDLKPFMQREEQLIYDYQDRVVFPAGKEFRHLDLRSFRYRSDIVREIEEYDDGYEIYLYTEEKRLNKNYSSINDINGRYVIENLDVSTAVDRRVAASQNIDFINFNANDEIHMLQGDYANVHFSLASPGPLYDVDAVYLMGAMNDWQLREDFRMPYNEDTRSYETQVLLKQGFYNYYYVGVKDDGKIIDIEDTEGNWFETENEYTILVYYRPFGSRYDQLVSARTFDTGQ